MLETFNYLVVPYTICPLDIAEEGQYYVLSLPTGELIKISEIALHILSELRTGVALSLVVDNLRRRYGLSLNESDLEIFIQDFLMPAHLLQDIEGKAICPAPHPRDTRLWLHIKLLDGSKLAWLARPFTVLFKPFAAVLILGVLLGLMFTLFLRGVFSPINTTPLQVEETNTGIVYLIVLLSHLFHELGHITSCYRFGVKPRGVGIGMYALFPVFFTNMSETWILDRKRRLITDLAGIYFQCVAMLACAVWLLFLPDSRLAMTVLGLNALSILMNLNPVTRFDGYWVFNDLLGIPNINRYTWRYLKSLLFRSRNQNIWSQARLPRLRLSLRVIFIIYCVLYALGTATVLALAIGLGIYVLVINPGHLLTILQVLFESIVTGQWLYFFEHLSKNSMYLVSVALLLYLGYTLGKVIVRSALSGKLKTACPARLALLRTTHRE